MKTIILVLVVLGFAVARIALPSHGLHPEDTFKDLAHLFVGGLFGAAIVIGWTNGQVYWWTAIGLTGVETLVAIKGLLS